jgi:hypothetical protein
MRFLLQGVTQFAYPVDWEWNIPVPVPSGHELVG